MNDLFDAKKLSSPRESLLEAILDLVECMGVKPREGDVNALQRAAKGLADAITVLVSESKGKKKPAANYGRKDFAGGRAVWDEYVRHYSARYRIEPFSTAQSARLCRQLFKAYGPIATEIVRQYLASNHSFYAGALHPLTLCVRDAATLVAEVQGARRPTAAQARQKESASSTADAIVRYAERKGIER